MRVCVLRTMKVRSEPIADAFAAGVMAAEVDRLTPQEYMRRADQYDIVAGYGILRGHYEAHQMAQQIGRDFVYIDHAYLEPAHYFWETGGVKDQSNFRVILNRYHADSLMYEPTTTPAVPLPRLSKSPQHVLFCPASDLWRASVTPEAIDSWEARVKSYMIAEGIRFTVRKKTQAREILRWPDFDCVAAYSSAITVEALRRYIPIWTSNASPTAVASSKPFVTLRNREDWGVHDLVTFLRRNQFSIRQMKDGVAWLAIQRQRSFRELLKHLSEPTANDKFQSLSISNGGTQ